MSERPKHFELRFETCRQTGHNPDQIDVSFSSFLIPFPFPILSPYEPVPIHPSRSSKTDRPLPPGQQWAAPGKWPIIGERSPAPWDSPWRLQLTGLVEPTLQFDLEQLRSLPQTTMTLDIHCVTRWSIPQVSFTGVLLSDLLAQTELDSRSRFISFVSHSNRKHSTSLPLDLAIELKTLIAHSVDGTLLEPAHGGPLRNIVPDRYFYKSVKWLAEIELLAEDRLGFWEAESGYHNEADPWQEQRYMAPTINRRAAAELIASRDFSGQDLRGIDARNRDLAGLNAANALLRDAHFEQANLRGADFSSANLSNAHLCQADLRDAQFCATDLEGADLAGADLRGADLTDASLIGAPFCNLTPDGKPINGAIIDTTTRLMKDQLEPLTPEQIAYVADRLKE